MTSPNPATIRHNLAFDSAGAGVPLLLIHAFPQARTMWAGQLAALADTAQVFAPDVFGFGESPLPPGGWTVDSMAGALADFLTDLGVTEPAVVGGLSMGGYIALAFARRHPTRVRALILADTKAEADTAEGKAGRDKMIAFAREQGAAAVATTMIPKVLGATTRATKPDVVEAVRRVGSAQSVDGIIAGLVALRDRPDATPGLGGIRVPTLVIVGTEDEVTPPSAARTIAAGIAGSQLVELPAVGHLSNLEDPAAFNGAVRGFGWVEVKNALERSSQGT